MDVILLALIIAGIVWFVRKQKGSGSGGKGDARIRTSLVSGVVTGSARHTEITVNTHTSGNHQQGFHSATSATSTLHQQFFVRQDNGVETPVQLEGANLPIADGQHVTVIFCEYGDQQEPGYLVNHTAQLGYQLFDPPYGTAVNLGAAPSTPMIFIRALGAAAVTGFLAWMLWHRTQVGQLLAISVPVVFVVTVFRQRARRRRIGRELMAEYQRHAAALLAAPPGPAEAVAAAGVTPAAQG